MSDGLPDATESGFLPNLPRTAAGTNGGADQTAVSALLDAVCQSERAMAFVLLTGGFSHGMALLHGFRGIFQQISDIGDRKFLRNVVEAYGGMECTTNPPPSGTLDTLAIDEVIPTLKRLYRTLSEEPFPSFTGDHMPRLEVGTHLIKAIGKDAERIRSALAHLRRSLLHRLGRSTRPNLEHPDATIAPFIGWARHCSSEMLQRAQALGEEVFRHAISSEESVVIVGRTIGATELRLYGAPEMYQRFATQFHDRIVSLALSRNGIVQDVSPEGFTIYFPIAVKIADHPLKAAFEFVRLALASVRDTINQWSRELRFRPLSHMDADTLESERIAANRSGDTSGLDAVAQGLGVGIGMDIGPVNYRQHFGHFTAAGATVERARRCAVGGPGTVVVNSALRWRVMRERRDPTSPLYFEDYPLIFQEHPIRTGDGNDFLAWDVLETPGSAGSADFMGEGQDFDDGPHLPMSGGVFGNETSQILRTRVRDDRGTSGGGSPGLDI